GQFLPVTNRWMDLYFDLDFPVWQEVERVTTRPDIVFTAGDIGPERQWVRTGTTNWANYADLNGNRGGIGPGVIQPPITITYNNAGPFYYLTSSLDTNAFPGQSDAYLIYAWGSFDGTTNSPIVYPDIQVTFTPSLVHLRLLMAGRSRDL